MTPCALAPINGYDGVINVSTSLIDTKPSVSYPRISVAAWSRVGVTGGGMFDQRGAVTVGQFTELTRQKGSTSQSRALRKLTQLFGQDSLTNSWSKKPPPLIRGIRCSARSPRSLTPVALGTCGETPMSAHANSQR